MKSIWTFFFGMWSQSRVNASNISRRSANRTTWKAFVAKDTHSFV
jgi:hypothetical protein